MSVLAELRGASRSWWHKIATAEVAGDEFRRRWRVMAPLFLLLLVAPVASYLIADSPPAWRVVAVLVLLACYSAGYLAMAALMSLSSFAVALGYGIGMLVVGFGLFALLGDTVLYTLIYATAAVAFVLPEGWALLLDGVALGVSALWLATVGRFAAELGDLVAVGSVTVALFFLGRLARAVQALRAAQAEIATLAATAEREGLARDLHDVLGHSLTTIAVKAGLIRRLLESGPDTSQAITEVREVEGLARGAMTEVRATVSGYREVSLSAELVGARAALRAAGITADLPQAVDDVREDLRSAFGYVLREAITNVLRHSDAGTVVVRWGSSWIEVINDGPRVLEHRAGNGLRGLAERLVDVGGVLDARPGDGGGFRLRAEVAATTGG